MSAFRPRQARTEFQTLSRRRFLLPRHRNPEGHFCTVCSCCGFPTLLHCVWLCMSQCFCYALHPQLSPRRQCRYIDVHSFLSIKPVRSLSLSPSLSLPVSVIPYPGRSQHDSYVFSGFLRIPMGSHAFSGSPLSPARTTFVKACVSTSAAEDYSK